VQLLNAGLGQHWLLGKRGLHDRPAWNSSGLTCITAMVDPICSHRNGTRLVIHPARGDARGNAKARCG